MLPTRPSLIVTNPPWGLRLAGEGDLTAAGFGADSTDGDYMDGVVAPVAAARRVIQPAGLVRRSSPPLGGGWGGAVQAEQSPDEPVRAAAPLRAEEEWGELETSWRSLSDFLRLQCGGVTAHVLSGNKDAVNYLRMRPAKKTPMSIGGIEVKLYEMRVLPPRPTSQDGDYGTSVGSYPTRRPQE